MNVYRGENRRQVGGGLFSTLSRGARPFLSMLLAKLKPMAMNLGKTVGKRAVKAALNVGTDLAANVLSGEMNRSKVKEIFSDEANKIKSDANEVVRGYKRKAETALGIQSGSGVKRRRKSIKMVKRRTKNKSLKRLSKHTKKSINKRVKRKRTTKKHKSAKKSINKKRIRKVFNDIFSKK